MCVFKAPRTYTPVLGALVSPLAGTHGSGLYCRVASRGRTVRRRARETGHAGEAEAWRGHPRVGQSDAFLN